MSNPSVKIYFDGGSRGNPGPASGAAYADIDGGIERACFLEHATNNEAEYRGLLMGIALAKEHKWPRVLFLGDSKLVVCQISGEWKAKHPLMNQLRLEALEELKSLPAWQIEWVRREFNAEADRVANQMMDSHQGLEPILPVISKVQKAESPAISTPLHRSAGLRADVQKLNELGAKASFGDFSKLKVGGMDDFSRATPAKLQELVPDFQSIHKSFSERLLNDRNAKDLPDADRAKLIVNALRWTARGLLSDLALRKVLVDLEVTNTIRGRKK